MYRFLCQELQQVYRIHYRNNYSDAVCICYIRDIAPIPYCSLHVTCAVYPCSWHYPYDYQANCAPYIILHSGGHYGSGYDLNSGLRSLYYHTANHLFPSTLYRNDDLVCSTAQCWDDLICGVWSFLVYIRWIKVSFNLGSRYKMAEQNDQTHVALYSKRWHMTAQSTIRSNSKYLYELSSTQGLLSKNVPNKYFHLRSDINTCTMNLFKCYKWCPVS